MQRASLEIVRIASDVFFVSLVTRSPCAGLATTTAFLASSRCELDVLDFACDLLDTCDRKNTSFALDITDDSSISELVLAVRRILQSPDTTQVRHLPSPQAMSMDLHMPFGKKLGLEPPLTVLVIKKVHDSTVIPPFLDLIKWLICVSQLRDTQHAVLTCDFYLRKKAWSCLSNLQF